MAEPHYRRRFQFRLRTLVVLVAILAVGLTWVALRQQQGARQRHAVEAILKLGGRIEYADGWEPQTSASDPGWLEQLHADVFSKPVTTIDWDESNVTDTGLAHLAGLTQLQLLDLRGTHVTDA